MDPEKDEEAMKVKPPVKRRRSSSPDTEHLDRHSTLIPGNPLLPVGDDDPLQEKKDGSSSPDAEHLDWPSPIIPGDPSLSVSHDDSEQEEENDSSPTKLSVSHLFFPGEYEIADHEELKPAMWKKLAIYVLEDYCRKQNVVLNLYGEVSSRQLLMGDIWGFHLDFYAKAEDDDSPKRLFAEVYWYKEGNACFVKFSGIMDPRDPDLRRGCDDCPSDVLHPKGMLFFRRPSSLRDFQPVDTPS